MTISELPNHRKFPVRVEPGKQGTVDGVGRTINFPRSEQDSSDIQQADKRAEAKSFEAAWAALIRTTMRIRQKYPKILR